MDELLAKANIKDLQLKNEIVKTVAFNLDKLSEPCYYPELKKELYTFLKLTNLTEKDIRDFTKRKWKGRKEASFQLHNDAASNFYIFLLQYFLKKNDKVAYANLMVLYVLRQYANLIHKTFKYCNPDSFKYALEILTKTHLFAREKTIANAIYYMAQEMIKRWTRALRTNDLDGISKFIQESRHRVSQSVKSFAQTYYKADKEGVGFQTETSPDEEDENAYQQQSTERSTKLIDDIAQKLTVYRFVDRKTQEEARRFSKIKASLATQIVSKLNNTEYADLIRLVLKLYIKDIQDIKQFCGKDYEKYLRQLMSLKRTKAQIYFKQQVGILLQKLLADFDYLKTYKSLTSQTQYLISLFLAYYLTSLLRHSVCIK